MSSDIRERMVEEFTLLLQRAPVERYVQLFAKNLDIIRAGIRYSTLPVVYDYRPDINWPLLEITGAVICQVTAVDNKLYQNKSIGVLYIDSDDAQAVNILVQLWLPKCKRLLINKGVSVEHPRCIEHQYFTELV